MQSSTYVCNLVHACAIIKPLQVHKDRNENQVHCNKLLNVQLVVISGLVWNWPTSCAWAARVYVNDRYAIAFSNSINVLSEMNRMYEFWETRL